MSSDFTVNSCMKASSDYVVQVNRDMGFQHRGLAPPALSRDWTALALNYIRVALWKLIP
jgi:hypothetical protein